MSLSAPFIHRPVATVLLTAAIALAGAVAFMLLPVSPLPQIDFPTITVAAAMPGASPETMASSVAAPLERQFGRIAGVTEMTSTSALGATAITLQFDLNRNIDAAARDVQAAINAARGYLPTDLPNNPTYRKVNPADAPIMILALTSDVYDPGRLYDLASTVMQQKLSQIDGVGQVTVGGSSLPAVRVEVNPTALNNYGLVLEDVRSMLSVQNANRPKGQIADDTRTSQLATNDQLLKAEDYKPLIVSYQNGAALKLSDIANVQDSVEDLRAAGITNGKPSVLLIISREPGANIIATVDRVREALPQLKASVPSAVDVTVVVDQTTTIRASVHDVERTLLISVGLVIMIVFIFLRNLRTILIPTVVVPVSLIGTFGVMYLCGYSLDNLSLMALTISTGFVVDDAIVVIENLTRHIEQGMRPMEAALKGAQEIGFTVLSISISLVAVFIPILLMGGIVGRLFREFAVTLSVAILVSLVVSLTTTPMMCSRLLKHQQEKDHGRLYRDSEKVFAWLLRIYETSLAWVLGHAAFTLAILLLVVGLNIYLAIIVPKGFFPQQDTGRIMGGIQAVQDTSFQAMRERMTRFVDIIRADPAVANVVAFTGGGASTTTNTGRTFIALKPLADRDVTADQLINRLRPKLATVEGAVLYLQSIQDLRIGGRLGNAQYQYTIQSDNLEDLTRWAPILLQEMRKLAGFTDVNSDQQNNGLQASLVYDRSTASRLGITPQMIDDTLYDAFGQRQVSTMYTQLNQYSVVMEVNPTFWHSPEGLKHIYLRSTAGGLVPLSAFSHYQPTIAPLTVNHQGLFPSVTVSFNLSPGVALGDAVNRIYQMEQSIGMPATIHGSFSGTLQAFQESLANEPLLIIAALVTVYIVLGILYESYIHPITILSTLPSAGVGAFLSLLICGMELDVIALIGIILLIGIVKKNAIMMIDFALAAERGEGKSPRDAIYQACLLRFRPIMMTTMAALLGALPLALGTGVGSELRRSLGIAIVGGLIFSQMLTLYTTPVVYLYLDRARLWFQSSRARRAGLENRATPFCMKRVPYAFTSAETTSGSPAFPLRRGRNCLESWIAALAAPAGMTFVCGLMKTDSVDNYRLPRIRVIIAALVLATSSACTAVGPDYVRPTAITPDAYKEIDGWKVAQPKDDVIRGSWWEMFGDPQLNALEAQVSISNQNLAAAEAQYRQAQALVRQARAAYFPTATIGIGANRSSGSTNTGTGSAQPRTTVSDYSLPLDVSWELDVWGRIRRTVESNQTNAQASAADLEAARLSAQAALAQNYFQLRTLDAQKQLLDATLAAFEKSLDLTKNRYASGIASTADVLQAETQLKTTQAQAIDVGVARAQTEHAIAVLIGQAASTFSLAAVPLTGRPPEIPVGVPSELLERRPDIAAAERLVASANAQIGVAEAAFYPSVILSASLGLETSSLAKLFTAASRFWSVGASISETVFDGGLRRAQTDFARAAYDANVATYRQTVLTAFQGVEDNLAALRILEDENRAQDEAVKAAQQSLSVITNQYKAGTVSYLNVITAQATALSNELTAIQILGRRMSSAVLLIQALGGGWNVSDLPSDP